MTHSRFHAIAVLAAATAFVTGAVAGCGTTTSGSTAASSAASSSSSVAVPSLTSAPLWAPPGTSALPPRTVKALQDTLAGFVKSGRFKGLTAAVVTPTGIWSGAVGVDGVGATLKPDAALWIASITKTFTAAEVMLLASRGLVDLDKPLTDYVPVSFDTKGATVRQVLAMRSGFPDIDPAVAGAAIAKDLGQNWSAAGALSLIPSDAGRLGVLDGSAYYNNTNYVLLGALVANVTQLSLAQALRRDLIDPAGLQRMWVQPEETPVAPLGVGTNASGTSLVDVGGPYLPSKAQASLSGGGGAMAGDAASLARWIYELYGGQVIDATLVREMEANPKDELSMGVQYALGTMVADDNGTPFYGHGGGGPTFPYTDIAFVRPRLQVAVAVLVPQPGEAPADVAMQLSDVADVLK